MGGKPVIGEVSDVQSSYFFKSAHQVVLPLLVELVLLLEEPFEVLDVFEEVAAVVVAVPVAAEVMALLAAQKLVYQDWMAVKSAVAIQLAAPQTWLTPAVPDSVNGVSRASEQKQLSLTVAEAGGEHAPWTSYSGPQRFAQAGSVENGTITPFAACAFVNWTVESSERIVTADGRIMMAVC